MTGVQDDNDRRARQGPAPGQRPLELDIECFHGAAGAGGTTHQMIIHRDWSIETPHDPEAEQIAEALGSYTSCVTHLEQIVAAFRASLGLLTRTKRIQLRLGQRGSWHLVSDHLITGCCRGTAFDGVAAAARHTRTAAHLARQHRVPRERFAAFLSAAAATWGSWEATPQVDHSITRLIQEPGGVGELWRAGIHPDDITTLAAVGAAVAEPLPASFFLGLVYGNADRRWVADVLPHRPDPDTAAWLVWLDEPQNRETPAAWGWWLSLGISKADVVVAVEAEIAPEYVDEVAAAVGLSTNAVAAQLARWAKADCRLTTAHLHALKRHGTGSTRPSGPAIASLCEMLAQGHGTAVNSAGTTPDRTELAVMLEILGNRAAVLAALRSGVRTVEDLDAHLDRLERVSR